MAARYQIPGTPRVISPSPTPSENGDLSAGYFAPITRSAAKRSTPSSSVISEAGETDSDPELDARARARSRSPRVRMLRGRQSSASTASNPASPPLSTAKDRRGSNVQKSKPLVAPALSNGSAARTTENGHLSPLAAANAYWRELSRSPSPLSLIPIHRHWRTFVHKHEIPRKALHGSIGFVTLYLYTRGYEPSDIHPWLLVATIPIASLDFLRHRSPRFNEVYIRVCGALMRETEVNDRYNGVIYYLAGAWVALRFFPKDVGVMSVLLLSWCDTAASTFGRLYGHYTPRLRRGKSLAGSLAAAVMGVATALLFWGWIVPRTRGYEQSFMFRGTLTLPARIQQALLPSTSSAIGTVTGGLALGIVSLWSGLVASVSEFIDVFDLDDNFTIPVFSAVGLWGFLRLFG